jgi:hypothetical protein
LQVFHPPGNGSMDLRDERKGQGDHDQSCHAYNDNCGSCRSFVHGEFLRPIP